MLILRVNSLVRKGNVQVHCGDVQFISGPTSWAKCEIEITHGTEGGFLINDPACGFIARAGTVEAFENCKPLN